MTFRGWPESDSKVTQKRLEESFLSHFRVIRVTFEPLSGQPRKVTLESLFRHFNCFGVWGLAHQNRTIAIASDFRVDGAKSPEIPQQEGALGSEIAARNRRSLATFHRTLKSQCIIAVSCFGNRAISGVRDGHRNRKSQKSLRFRCAKV